MKYYGFLDFEIKREFRQNDQLNQIVTNFKDEIENPDHVQYVKAEEIEESWVKYSEYLSNKVYISIKLNNK